MATWTESSVGDQSGRVGIVTGGNSGIGWETVRVLAANGAKVILACRSESRGQDGIDRVKALQPQAALEFLKLDLADLESVKEAAAAFNGKYDRLDLLINNAGLMATPEKKTAQGFDMQLGVNHFGHFAFTG